MRNTRTLFSIATAALAATTAGAQVHVGEPIILDQAFDVTVHYMSASTSLDGLLWLDADSRPDAIDFPLFFNRSGLLGFEHELGRYDAGDRIDFIYDIISTGDTFRTDDPMDILQYRWRWDTPDIILVEIDDIRFPMGDGDYNDMRFEVRFHQIPAPFAVAALPLLALARPRRRPPR